jgi:hypothetical protein
MRNLALVLAGAALTLIAIMACTARDDGDADTTGEDTVGASGGLRDSVADARDTTPSGADAPSTASPARRQSDARPGAPIPSDSVRATPPTSPAVVPDSNPGRWRGLRLPESRPVRPIDSARTVEQHPDSVMKGDSTRPRPPQPSR